MFMLFSTIGIAASDFLCVNLSTIASILGMSESLAGVTFLAFGNGSPDVFSTFAAMSTHSGSLAVGELIGAASFITAVVAGSMALVRPFKVARKSFVRDVGFFVVAGGFSMGFLADGSLRPWECAAMIGFYVFYVCFVVLWHMYVGRRKRRKERDKAARSQSHTGDGQDLDIEGSSEEEDGTGEMRSLLSPDFGASEMPAVAIPAWKVQDEDVDDDTRDRYLKELQGEMQLSRPNRQRRNTIAPIRPSLVGALDFRSALQSLEKNKNFQEVPISLRRYSVDVENPFLSVPSIPGQASFDQMHDESSDLDLLKQKSRSGASVSGSGSGRARAVSANDPRSLKLDTTFRQDTVPEIDLSGPDGNELSREQTREISDAIAANQVLLSPRFSLSPPHSEHSSRAASPAPSGQRHPERDHLAPPTTDFYNPNYRHPHHGDVSPILSPGASPQLRPQIPRINLPESRQSRSGALSPISSPLSTPRYVEDDIRSIRSIRSMSRVGSISVRRQSTSDSLRPPPPSLSPDTAHTQSLLNDDEEPRVFKWWPYLLLPPPQVLFSTIFPTLYDWRDKNIWERSLGVIAAPSIFLLTLTLPVVEPDKDDDEDFPNPDLGLLSPEQSRSRSNTMATLPPDSPTHTEATNGATDSTKSKPAITKSPVVTFPDRDQSQQNKRQASDPHVHNVSNTPVSSPKEWSRWLLSTQTVLSPLFVVLIIWANIDDTLDLRNLLRPILFALLASLVLLAIIITTTTPTRPPKYRPLFCFLGFIVAMAWISTLANEVVGVLKAFGVILGISDAILGLTIFAVGSSLSDLVANITIARLGYPVMALSACFGGPMLNILLGIGIGGLYMTVKDSNHKHDKHPDRPIKYKPYEIEVSSTLMISGVTLLVTLIGLLIVVPMNGWRMDRKVGWGLVALWGLGTIGNVVVEVLGWGGDLELFR
jgi:solute carrier family 24 (sodium/potassium/calcium exchanger), member 6